MRHPVALCFGLLLAACSPAQLVWEKPIAPGMVYREEVDRALPRVIHALRITPGSPALRLVPELTGGSVNELASAPTGRTGVGKLAAQTGALAAINADFFVDQATGWNGHPLGLLVREGEILATPNPKRAVFAWGPGLISIGKANWQGEVRMDKGVDFPLNGLNRACGPNEAILNTPAAGQAVVGEAGFSVVLKLDAPLSPTCTVPATVELVTDDAKNRAVEAGKAVLVARGKAIPGVKSLKPGDKVAIALTTSGFDWEKIDAAVGGGPMLVQGGETAVDGEEEGFNTTSFVAARHPRTAIGRTADGDIWLVAVDGRNSTSAGASLPELAAIMRRLGCTEAMNLDGGGSTTLTVFGLTLNRPSDGRERPVADAIIVRGPKPEAPDKLKLIVPATISDGDTVDAVVQDATGKPIPNAKILWVASGSVWIDQGGRVRVLTAGDGTIQATVGGRVLSVKVTAKKSR